jgi:mono/diheme cytochrome c family protein
LRTTLTATLLGLVLLIPAHAQQPTDPAARPDHVGLSELMTATQIRHIKLWFAGKLGNWKLAAYELDQIASDLDQAATRVPAGAAFEQVVRQIAALRSSMEARDVPGFSKAYGELTSACNSCHRAAGRGFISVQVPAVSPFADQDFADQVAEGRTLAYNVCGVCHVVPDKPNVPLALGFSAPSFIDLARRPSFTEKTLRQLLASDHRRVGPAQAMPNPRLNDTQIDDIVAYFEALKAEQKKSP